MSSLVGVLPACIDCGLEGDSNYTEQFSGIIYSPDAGYVDDGVNVDIPRGPLYGSLVQRYRRSLQSCVFALDDLSDVGYFRQIFDHEKFPERDSELLHDGPCEGGRQVPVESRVLVRQLRWQEPAAAVRSVPGREPLADGEYTGEDTVIAEIIAISPTKVLQVCLVNTGMGTPFISVLEMRPLRDFMYPLVNESQSLVLNGKRVDYGGSGSTRYPVDPYDRIWFENFNPTGWRTVRATGEIIRPESDWRLVPAEVLRTATVAESLTFSFSSDPQEKLYVFMYFAELQRLGSNETREINVFSSGELWYGPYRPKYMTAEILYTFRPGTGTSHNYTLLATENSTLPPIINAREVYSLKQLEELPTGGRDGESPFLLLLHSSGYVV
ncbi:unnamed protein product [Spirodela intermedia]|uniref:Malectin-like domain-containing protein n=1 Tax=Spirodela intermedia TaxID=51605 RepID=A0ABN7ED47_SPIIN|nr:unnamed protein product [Spirodela intermedia]